MKKTLLFVLASVLVFGVFAFAEEDSTGSDASGQTATITTISTDAIACVKTAVETRESTIKSAMDAYYATRNTTFAARTIAITDALFQPTKQEIKKAADAAIKTYKTAMDAARNVKKNTVQKARTAYRTAMKACKGDVANVLKDQNGKSDLTY